MGCDVGYVPTKLGQNEFTELPPLYQKFVLGDGFAGTGSEP